VSRNVCGASEVAEEQPEKLTASNSYLIQVL